MEHSSPVVYLDVFVVDAHPIVRREVRASVVILEE